MIKFLKFIVEKNSKVAVMNFINLVTTSSFLGTDVTKDVEEYLASSKKKGDYVVYRGINIPKLSKQEEIEIINSMKVGSPVLDKFVKPNNNQKAIHTTHSLDVAERYSKGGVFSLVYKITAKNEDVIFDSKGILKVFEIEDFPPEDFNHDISKPYVRVVDNDGKEHYPNHSYESYILYIERFGVDEYAFMILHDMDFHKLRGKELVSLWEKSYSDHIYATAWAEIYANAELFGGFESDSFKIKRKRLVKGLNYERD